MAPENVHLIGHSLGAQLAAEAGRRLGAKWAGSQGVGAQGDVGWGMMEGEEGRVTQPAGGYCYYPRLSSGRTDTEQHQH